MTNSIHYLENADGRMLAQAFKKAELPKLKGAIHVEMKLEPYQIRMIEEGLPSFLLMTQGQRAADWRANPPKAMPRMPSAADREKALAEERARMAKEQLANQQQSKEAKKAPSINTTGMKWNLSRSRWEPDPDYDPKQQRQEKPKVVSPVAEVTADDFQSNHGAYAEMRLKIVAKVNPRKEGTKAYEKWQNLETFLKRFPDATAAEVFASTIYQKNDLQWDVAKKSIKIVEG